MANQDPLPLPIDIPFSQIKGLNREVVVVYSERETINDAFSDTLGMFIMRTRLDYKQAVEQRRLIGLQIKNLQ